MRRSILCVTLLIPLMPIAHAAALPGDIAVGKRLHDVACMGCHNTDVYARKDRVVQSLDALKEQLVSCSYTARAELSTSEMQYLLKYLNEHFYHSAKLSAGRILSGGSSPLGMAGRYTGSYPDRCNSWRAAANPG